MVASLTSTVCRASRSSTDKEKARLSYMKSGTGWTPLFSVSSSLDVKAPVRTRPEVADLPFFPDPVIRTLQQPCCKKQRRASTTFVQESHHLEIDTVRGNFTTPHNEAHGAGGIRWGSGDACAGHRLYCCTLSRILPVWLFPARKEARRRCKATLSRRSVTRPTDQDGASAVRRG